MTIPDAAIEAAARAEWDRDPNHRDGPFEGLNTRDANSWRDFVRPIVEAAAPYIAAAELRDAATRETMADYTPTTDRVREAYFWDLYNDASEFREQSDAEFDRWLEQVSVSEILEQVAYALSQAAQRADDEGRHNVATGLLDAANILVGDR